MEFGGNTACVLVEIEGEPPLILDLGTGLAYLGRDLMARVPSPGVAAAPFRGTALLSHLHWDHIQGLPFFRPLLTDGAQLDIYGPCQPESSIAQEMASFIRPPVFPVSLADLPGTVVYNDVGNEKFTIGSATVTSFSVPHVGPTNGYRVDSATGSLAFVCDHQQPRDGSLIVPPHIVEACRGIDVLIHDSQYDHEEFAIKCDWGHCTAEFALELARLSGAGRLVLFHHDPAHGDDWIRRELARVRVLAGPDIEVMAAAEGMTLRSG